MPKRPYSFRELHKRLKKEYGVYCEKSKGKGSERIFYRPNEPETKKGPQFTIKCHGEGDEISVPVIKALLRRFEISEAEFWD
jgi:hypothetical protein